MTQVQCEIKRAFFPLKYVKETDPYFLYRLRHIIDVMKTHWTKIKAIIYFKYICNSQKCIYKCSKKYQ